MEHPQKGNAHFVFWLDGFLSNIKGEGVNREIEGGNAYTGFGHQNVNVKKKITVREAKPCAWTVKPDVFF